MFGISFSEIVLILVIALIVLGPKKLPIVVHKTANIFLKIKLYLEAIKRDVYLQNDFSEINKTKENFLHTYNQIKDDLVNIASTSKEEKLYQPELDFNKTILNKHEAKIYQ
ncbi:MAG TPA: twin-arginine translocase TatA/TatE family subunit [Burkholderiales bacterium]|nr:twin-arginine translocase TatA/TatE family subunit [Burkholderiales bacterium]